MTLGTVAARLAALDIDAVLHTALAGQADAMAEAVRASLAQTPGGTHEAPWERSGTLHASIGSDADADGAVVGSTDPVALYQERGTAKIPPRPFLAPVAVARSADAASAVGAAVAGAIRGVIGER